ncbi:MAG: chorismate-binding protein [Chlamydiales bacterium]|nr:chorismate-binding protein [Chlamydiia bacterium]MCP5508221.1 chorismate-binding protein [Chlamydiales bacterium]
MNLAKFLQSGAIIALSNGSLLIGEGKRTWIDVNARQEGPVFYFPDFFLEDEYQAFTHESVEELTREQLMKELTRIPHPPVQPISWKESVKDTFEEQFTELQALLADEKLKKGVPIAFDEGEGVMSQARILSTLIAALENSKKHPLYLYGYWDRESGMIGLTPELLFDVDHANKTAKTVACAGTVSDEEQIDQKLLNEHQFVVKGIAETLYHIGTVVTGKRQLVTFPHLCHLVTPIKLQARSMPSIMKLVEALHPTPALGAYPKNEGEEWLRRYQTTCNRQRFGAPAGVLHYRNKSSCYVAIRNVQWNNGTVRVGAGCGVVPQSNLEDEWQELQLKLNATKSQLGLVAKT